MIQIKALQIRLLFFFLFLCVLVKNTQPCVKSNLPKYSLDQFKDYCKTENRTIVVVKDTDYLNKLNLDHEIFTNFHTVFIEVDKIETTYSKYNFKEQITLVLFIGCTNIGFIHKLMTKEDLLIRLITNSNQKSYNWPPFKYYSFDQFNNYCKTENRTIVIINSLIAMAYIDSMGIYSKIKSMLDVVFIKVKNNYMLFPENIKPMLILYKNCSYMGSITEFLDKKNFIEKFISISNQKPNRWQPSY